ncbi:MAG TPA: RsmE family RNA methyltransferase [Bacteroidales bacterium]|jgi:16S rRNA (uracil1498-N3)-methyltransferase|nr:16S rRNA (uracil(1498)-N(3))-methyltransferase [Bacteroidales bacterium]HNV96140.1 RsmE family RNA methyltransferase [Bacteroidales bacterium]
MEPKEIKQNINCFYIPEIESQFIQLPEEESKHAVKALRLQPGDQLLLSNGNGKLAISTIVSNDYKKTIVEVNKTIETSPLPYKLHIAMSPLQHSDRFEWFIEKAVELGIEQITPLLCHRTEKKHINLERMNKICISALKQSRQSYLPKINSLQKIDDFIKTETNTNKAIARCEGERVNIKNLITSSKSTSYTILIGPEGDFTEKEWELAQQYNFTPIFLGSNVLRSETAAIFVAAAFRYEFIY